MACRATDQYDKACQGIAFPLFAASEIPRSSTMACAWPLQQVVCVRLRVHIASWRGAQANKVGNGTARQRTPNPRCWNRTEFWSRPKKYSMTECSWYFSDRAGETQSGKQASLRSPQKKKAGALNIGFQTTPKFLGLDGQIKILDRRWLLLGPRQVTNGFVQQ